MSSPAETGRALAAHAEEALRLWRAARRHARPGTFPGLLDALVEPFVRAVGETLVAGAEPARAWEAVAGVARYPGDAAGAEHDEEWMIAGEVAAAVADALHAGPEAHEHAVAAARACAEATRWLGGVPGPSRGPVLKVLVLAGGRLPARR